MTTAVLKITENDKIANQVIDFLKGKTNDFDKNYSHLEVNKYTYNQIRKSIENTKVFKMSATISICGYRVNIVNSLPNWTLYLEGYNTNMPIQYIYPTINYGFAPVDTKLPKKVIINDGATVLIWSDGDKTIVKRAEDDSFDPVKGFLWAYFQKHSGLSKTKANKYLRNIDKENKPTVTLHIDNANLGSFIKNIFKED